MHTMTKDYCIHCLPTRRTNHASLHVDHHVNSFVRLAALPFSFWRSSRLSRRMMATIWDGFLDVLAVIRIVSFTDTPDRSRLHNRSLIFFDEAKRRGIKIEAIRVFGKYINEFRFMMDGKRYYFDSIPLAPRYPVDDIDDKALSKRLLEKSGFPVSEGRYFTNERSALRYGRALDYPLVTKPSNGSLSHHVTCEIGSSSALQSAIRIARRYSPGFVIERHIPGMLYRATVIGKERVYVCRKEPANVVGDGISDIARLVDLKNREQYRGPADRKDVTLHMIPKDAFLDTMLDTQGLTRSSILPEGKKVFVQEKHILSQGCDIITCTEDTDAQNMMLFRDIAKLFDVDLIGIDFICEDISRPYDAQLCAVIETNSLPYADMHQNPSHGTPDPVAREVWDTVLARSKKEGTAR